MKTFNSIHEIKDFFETAPKKERDEVIQRYVEKMLLSEFNEAISRVNSLNSISPPKIDLDGNIESKYSFKPYITA